MTEKQTTDERGEATTTSEADGGTDRSDLPEAGEDGVAGEAGRDPERTDAAAPDATDDAPTAEAAEEAAFPAEGGGQAPGHEGDGTATEEGVGDATLSQELDHLQAEFDELNDRHLRLAAEFNNYRRRQETQMTEAWGRAQADLVGRLLEVLDDLQRVSLLDPADEAVTVESIVEGIDLVERKFVRQLEEAGAEVVEPAEGEAFDPELMEAMMRVPDESGEREDEVADVFQKGYLFRGNLVRPARVSVYKG